MGQKRNTLGFRLGTTQSHHSLWFAQLKNDSEGLQEDQQIRDCIKNYVQKNRRISYGVEGIAQIEIQKRIDLIQVIIYIGFPKYRIPKIINRKSIVKNRRIKKESLIKNFIV